jgi:hypothetical protein
MSCQECPDGTYANMEGMTSCSKCPNGLTNIGTDKSNATSCVAHSCPSIYEDSNYPGQKFFQTENANFTDASIGCFNSYSSPGRLVVPVDSEELVMLEGQFGIYNWVGLEQVDTSDEPSGGWKWLNGTSMSQPNSLWSPGEPNDVGNTEQCGMNDAGGVLTDYDCTEADWFGICEILANGTCKHCAVFVCQ